MYIGTRFGRLCSNDRMVREYSSVSQPKRAVMTGSTSIVSQLTCCPCADHVAGVHPGRPPRWTGGGDMKQWAG